MNRTEILEEFSASNDRAVAKGKRLRQSFCSVSSSGGGDEINCNSSQASSGGIYTSTLEDEDMANCLILLARSCLPTTSENEFSSRNFLSAANPTSVKVGRSGVYVHECKTCSRTFPSFQALGGHRASHKKPKLSSTPPLPEGKYISSSDEAATTPSRISAQSSPSKISSLNVENKLSRIHGCSVCGSEFGSGQALGGHMRRHRPGSNSSTVRPSANIHHSSLNLDLNLPALQEDECRDECRETHNHFRATQQPRLVFSAVALVDYHY